MDTMLSDGTVEIKVLTFNLWGIFNSKHRQERMRHFASKVAHYDVILLQEQFSADDMKSIIRHLPPAVRESRYVRRFPSSFYGSGCAIISRFPIRSAFFHTYPLQGYPEMLLHGDFFANKGAAAVKLDVPVRADGALRVQEVTCYITHLVAVYQKVRQLASWRHERYLPFRLSQAISLADFISSTSKPTDNIIIGGDFNASQRSLEVQMFLILLKRRGFNMHSVLPLTSASLEEGHIDSTREHGADSAYTISHKNAFNKSSTSYFKLLQMEADLPAQIDHLFFCGDAFTLKPFDTCPDASFEGPYVAYVQGVQAPSGVVVFTQNDEVPLPPEPNAPERLALVVEAVAELLPGSLGAKARNTSYWLRSLATSPALRPTETHKRRCPLSDHYGVAANLQLHVNPKNSAPMSETLLGTASSVPLTLEELMVAKNAVEFLRSHAEKLRRQAHVARYMSVVSLSTVGISLFYVVRAARMQEECTATMLRQVYSFGSHAGTKQAPAPAYSKETVAETVRKLMHRARQTVMGPSGHSSETREGDTPRTPSVTLSSLDFTALAREICSSSALRVANSLTLLTVASTLLSFLSLTIGVIHRTGNAVLLEEQVRDILDS